MNQETNRPASQYIAFDGSLNDIGQMRDALAVQAEARWMLADHASTHPSESFLGRLSLCGSIS